MSFQQAAAKFFAWFDPLIWNNSTSPSKALTEFQLRGERVSR